MARSINSIIRLHGNTNNQVPSDSYQLNSYKQGFYERDVSKLHYGLKLFIKKYKCDVVLLFTHSEPYKPFFGEKLQLKIKDRLLTFFNTQKNRKNKRSNKETYMIPALNQNGVKLHEEKIGYISKKVVDKIILVLENNKYVFPSVRKDDGKNTIITLRGETHLIRLEIKTEQRASMSSAQRYKEIYNNGVTNLIYT